MTEDIPVLYILMRTDLESMNAGKAVAQGGHAANMFAHCTDRSKERYKHWISATNEGFGTTIVLSVNEKQMYEAVSNAGAFSSNIVHDPTYPIQDGEVVHHIPLDTCAYVFGYKEDLVDVVFGLELMK